MTPLALNTPLLLLHYNYKRAAQAGLLRPMSDNIHLWELYIGHCPSSLIFLPAYWIVCTERIVRLFHRTLRTSYIALTVPCLYRSQCQQCHDYSAKKSRSFILTIFMYTLCSLQYIKEIKLCAHAMCTHFYLLNNLSD